MCVGVVAWSGLVHGGRRHRGGGTGLCAPGARRRFVHRRNASLTAPPCAAPAAALRPLLRSALMRARGCRAGAAMAVASPVPVKSADWHTPVHNLVCWAHADRGPPAHGRRCMGNTATAVIHLALRGSSAPAAAGGLRRACACALHLVAAAHLCAPARAPRPFPGTAQKRSRQASEPDAPVAQPAWSCQALPRCLTGWATQRPLSPPPWRPTSIHTAPSRQQHLTPPRMPP